MATKHFCDLCGKEIPRSFLPCDIKFKIIIPNKFQFGFFITTGQKFIMVCEKCIMNQLEIFFMSRRVEIEFEENEKLKIEKLSTIKQIKELLKEHPIGAINEEALVRLSLSQIKKALADFKDDLMPEKDELGKE